MATTVTGNETDRLLDEGKAAARKGDKEGARSILTQVVERDPHNEQAWMWLSGVVDESEEQRICLENVLVINPNNIKAQRGLDYILQKANLDAVQADGIGLQIPDAVGEYTTPLSSEIVNNLETAGHASIPPPIVASSAGPGLPAWLQAALTNGGGGQETPKEQAAPVESASDGQGQTELSQELWGGTDAVTLSPDMAPPWADQSNNQTYSQRVDSNAGHLTGSDLPSNLEPFSPFGAAPGGMESLVSGNMGPMGPMGPDIHLPQPNELPAFQEGGGQPWYLQGAENAGATSEPTGYAADAPVQAKKEVTLVACPSCSEKVPETSLSCSNCRYNFFVNCPACHELIDAGDAKPNVVEACPYCSTEIDKFELGITGTEKGAAYLSERVESESKAEKAMKKIAAKKERRSRGLNLGWAVDLLWLIAIVATVWALSQLPVWLKLTGQY